MGASGQDSNPHGTTTTRSTASANDCKWAAPYLPFGQVQNDLTNIKTTESAEQHLHFRFDDVFNHNLCIERFGGRL